MMRRILLFIMLPLLVSFAQWKSSGHENVSAEIQIDKNQLSLDQELNITLKLQYPEGFAIDPLEIESHLLQGFSSLSSYFLLVDSQQIAKENGFLELHYTLEPMIPGTYLLSFLNIPFRSDKGEQIDLFTDVFEINVSSSSHAQTTSNIIAKPLALSNAPPINLSDENRAILWDDTHEAERNIKIFKKKEQPLIIFITAFCFVALFLVLKNPITQYLKKKFAPVPLTPQQRALVNLKSIQGQPLRQKGDYEVFYVDLTNTVRQYIEERYQIRAPHLTTQEFLVEARENQAFDESEKKKLKEFLDDSDMVKFAEKQPTDYDCQKALETARNLIV